MNDLRAKYNITTTSHDKNKTIDLFGSVKDFKRASKTYWKIQLNPNNFHTHDNRDKSDMMSPLSKVLPNMDNNIDVDYYLAYRDYILNGKLFL